MRLVFMGTPHFAVPPLRSLAAVGHDIAAVVTRVDKPAGRGRAISAPPVKEAAGELGIPVLQPRRVRDPEFIAALGELQPDAIVVAAYGQILPKEILFMPRLKAGCINIHASLLPAYRGAAPINWAIIRGEQETGITIMRMDEGMDTGDILLQERLPIGPRDTAGQVLEKMSALGAQLIVTALPLIAEGKLAPIVQDHAAATLAPLLKKQDGRIDWSLTAAELHNRVRGLSPWPGAFSELDNRTIKVLETEPVDGTGEPGQLYEQADQILDIGTGHGLLRVLSLQPEGKKPMTAAEFLRGHRGVNGKRFERRSE